MIKSLKQIYNSLKEESELNSNFWKWFGNSKIKKGSQPLICYHGSNDKDVKIFDLNKVGKNTDSGMWGKGFYFTPDIKYAATYNRNGKDGNVLGVYLKMKNPLIIKSKNDIPKITVPDETIEDMENGPENYSKMFRDYLIENKFDGVIANISNPPEYVVLFPNQIKSVDNNGSWNLNNGDIYS